MTSRQTDVGDALETLILGPFVAFAVSILFLMVARMYVIFGPRITDGPFADAYEVLGTSLSVSYSLYQLVSSVEIWIAIGILAIAAYSLVVGLGGGRRRSGRRR